MLIPPASPVSSRTEFRQAYAESWALRDFTGSADERPLKDAFVRHGLAAEWIEDPAGWRALRLLWVKGIRPNDVPLTVVTADLRRSGRRTKFAFRSPAPETRVG